MDCQAGRLQMGPSTRSDEGDALQERLHALVLGQIRLEDILMKIDAGIDELRDKSVERVRNDNDDQASVSDASLISREAQSISQALCKLDYSASGRVSHAVSNAVSHEVSYAVTRETSPLKQDAEPAPSKMDDITSVETLLRLSHSIRDSNYSDSPASAFQDTRRKRYRLRELKHQMLDLFPIHPNSKFRTSWDVLSMFLLVYESVMVPFVLVFHIKDSWAHEFNNITLGFWTADICLNFLTGVYRQGCLIMELRHISRYYLRRTFVPDLLVVAGDWMMLLSNEVGSPMLKVLRVLKINRALRLAAMIKSGKMAQLYDRVYHKLMTYGLSGHFQFALGIGKLMCGMLWLNHVGCCLWVAVGGQSLSIWYQDNMHSASEKTWTSEEVTIKYLLAFYWSMTSMVSGASTMHPTNWKELLFVIFFVLCGLIVGGSIISSLAAMLMEFLMLNADHNRRLKLLRRYLFENKVGLKLAVPIERELIERTTTKRRLSPKEVEILELLSTNLLAELWTYIFSPCLVTNPFFLACQKLDSSKKSFLKSICSEAMAHDVHEPGARIFSPAASAIGRTLCIGASWCIDMAVNWITWKWKRSRSQLESGLWFQRLPCG